MARAWPWLCLVTLALLSACGGPAPTPLVIPSRARGPTPTPAVRPTGTPTHMPTIAPTRRPTPEGLPVDVSLGEAWVRPADGMTMVFVPGGTFLMGTAEDDPLVQDDELPQHPVMLHSFWIDQTEVTNAQYARCVAAGVCQPPFAPVLTRHADYYGNPDFDDYPVIYVSWLHGSDYCSWVGGSLPGEAQWEYAARGPESLIYPWGDDPPSETRANYGQLVNDTTAVGSYPQGASWCGALDMAGNVYEWVADWYGRYPSEAQTDPAGPERGIGHVLRGGSWYDPPEFLRAANRHVIREAYRDYTAPTGHGFNLGFRCAVTP